MRWLARLLMSATFAVHAGAATGADCRSLEPMSWLLGEWIAEGESSSWLETWTRSGPGTWEGAGVETPKSDPAKASVEDLRLVEMGGAVFYLAKVTHNELPVAFRLVECGGDTLTFANSAHDFPRRLDYARQPDGRLRVRVSDGGAKGFTLDFTRAAAAGEGEAAVLAAEDARFAAMVAADAGQLRRWLADDLAYVHSTGAVESREDHLEAIRAGKLRYFAIEPSERRVVFSSPDAAHVIGLARLRAQAGPATADFRARYLAIYVRRAGEWRLRAWQSLRLP